MKLLLDANVLVAALVSRGLCAELLGHCMRRHKVISSRELLREIATVLGAKFGQSRPDIESAVELFAGAFTLVQPQALAVPVCRDSQDDVVLATALAASCHAIVTGDRDLLVLDPYRGVRILSPAEFWKYEAGQPPA